MLKNGKKNLRMLAIGASLANGYWASLTQSANGVTSWSPVLMAMAAVWASYFSLTWLMQGMRSKY